MLKLSAGQLEKTIYVSEGSQDSLFVDGRWSVWRTKQGSDIHRLLYLEILDGVPKKLDLFQLRLMLFSGIDNIDQVIARGQKGKSPRVKLTKSLGGQ